jgi:UDP-GlcNAc3NAcA epimerase
MPKILSVVGARPQFVKASPVSRALKAAGAQELMLHTGQHYDAGLSQVFFDELEIPPPLLNLGVGSGSHAEQTAQMLVGIEKAVLAHEPDWVLVYGDTNSTLAGALAACKLHFRVAHVEAGLRSFNRRMPEEVNRVVADALADLLFVPTQTAIDNLLREGVAKEKIHLVGDVMFDAAREFGERARLRSKILERLALTRGGYVLATIHRAENTDDPARLANLFQALAKLASERKVVLPLHPRTRKALESAGLATDALTLIEPVGYLDMAQLERNAAVIATDSGGVQKEAFFYRVPCVTLRDETEWVELVELGWNRVCPPTGVERIVGEIRSAVGTQGRDAPQLQRADAAQRIAQVLCRER